MTGNFIGVQAPSNVQSTLQPLLNGGSGIYIDGGIGNMIGGTTASAANVIAYNGSAGVFVNSGRAMPSWVIPYTTTRTRASCSSPAPTATSCPDSPRS